MHRCNGLVFLYIHKGNYSKLQAYEHSITPHQECGDLECNCFSNAFYTYSGSKGSVTGLKVSFKLGMPGLDKHM